MPAEDASPQLSRLLDGHPPESTALVQDGRRWSYAELSARAGALAAELDGLAGERVAFILPTCADAVTVYLACFRAGAVATPLNTRYAPPEIEAALRRARPRWLIVDESREERLDGVDPSVLDGVRVLVTGHGGRHEPLAPLLAADSEEGQVPVAFVVRRDGSDLTADALTGFLRDRLAEYKVPSRIHFLAALPLTASGKIAHHELHEPD